MSQSPGISDKQYLIVEHINVPQFLSNCDLKKLSHLILFPDAFMDLRQSVPCLTGDIYVHRENVLRDGTVQPGSGGIHP